MTDEELAVNWIRSQGWSEENLPSDEFGQMFQAFLAGLKAGRQEKWHNLKKNPKDLPNNMRAVWTNVGSSYYDHTDHCWRDEYSRTQGVIAWCEPKFEE